MGRTWRPGRGVRRTLPRSGTAGGREVECPGQGIECRSIIVSVVTQLQAGLTVAPSGVYFTSPFFLLAASLQARKSAPGKKSVGNTCVTGNVFASVETTRGCNAPAYEVVLGMAFQYLIDPLLPYGQVIAETNGSNSLVSEYVFGLDRVSQLRSGAAHYYLADGQGSTRLLTDSTGMATDSTVYTAFGEVLFSSGFTPNPYLYTGEQFDGSAGLYNLRARYLDPRAGRFVSVDPFEGDNMQPTTLHRYGYVGGSPISFFDPTGMLQFSTGGQAVATGGLGILSSLARISFKLFMTTRIYIPLLAAAAVFNSDVDRAAITERILKDPIALEELKRRKRVLENEVSNKSGGKALLFHYGDRARVHGVYSTGELPASEGYAKGGRPPGAYASSIPPWFATNSYTQRMLAITFYNNPNRDVSYFVAFIKSPKFNKAPGMYEYVAPAPANSSVEVNPVAWGANLMLW